MTKKILSIIVALVAIVAIPIGISTNDADASSEATGTYSVYAYDGVSWNSDVVYTYDAAQAVQESAMWDNQIILYSC